MRRLLLLLIAAWSAGAAVASALLPGSINFNDSALWEKEVRFGFDDNGNYTGTTRWYLGSPDGSARVLQHFGSASGYLRGDADTDVHRTISALQTSESVGPTADHGQDLPLKGVYIDTQMSVVAHDRLDEVRVQSEKDKINAWLYISPDETVTNFVLTAGYITDGGRLIATNYVTDAQVTPEVNFRFVLRALPDAIPEMPGLVGFEVYVNDILVKSDGRSVFPSMVPPDSAYGKRLYSLGVAGLTSVEKINFTMTDPMEDPEYDRDDVTMLREYAEITIEGYPKASSSLMGFPVLVRISEARIPGFYYARAASDGSDLRFTDENGNLLPCEVDTWNPEGESLVWVKVPLLKNGAKLTMHWSLQHGTSLPKNNPYQVWSDYAAVWHFSEAAGGAVRDATGHGHTAKVTGSKLTVAADSAIGIAGTIARTAEESRDSLVAPNCNLELSDGEGAFTFTGWYKASGYEDGATMADAFAGMKWGEDLPITAPGGWAMHLASLTSLDYYAGGSAKVTVKDLPSLSSYWFHIGYTRRANNVFSFHANGENVGGGELAYAETNLVIQLLRNGFSADELRISKVVRSDDWVRAEYGQSVNRNYLVPGNAVTKGTDNYWVEMPTVHPTAVPVADAGSIVIFGGKPRYGRAIVRIYDAAGNQLEKMPTEAGSYRVRSTVQEGVRDGLEYEMSFVIFEERSYQAITGYDRIMLFNSDTASEAPVQLQGLYDIDSKTNEVWEHSGPAWKGRGRFVVGGTEHEYYEAETHRRLWSFRHARLGNLFQSDTALTEGMHLLPWGGTACRFDDSEMPANSQRYAGTLILQNRSTETHPDDPAGAYSPFYEGGIGTIYFDAVNAFAAYENTLKVQVFDEDDEDVTYGEWKDVPVDVFTVREGVCSPEDTVYGTNVVALRCKELSGTTNWFYRVRAHVDIHSGLRMRIVRCDREGSGWGEDSGDDGEGLVVLDNIIVSPPAMGVEIEQFGAPADTNDFVCCGQRAPFDIAFPTAADLGRLHGQVKVNYIANNESEDDPTFVGSLTMHYRWRYLNQSVGDWKELVLTAAPDNPRRFVSTDPIVGEGIGDVEYYCAATVNAPFYRFWDYAGLNWSWPDEFSERRGNVAISAAADGVYGPDNLSPALGTNYFIRLREGQSDYQGFRVHLRRAGVVNAPETVINMELSADHTWRGLYQTLTNFEQGVEYRISALNLQTQTGCDYQWSTNWYHGLDKETLPANDVLVEGAATEWTTIPCDAVTGYLMFQIEDTTKSISIIHADYQNFNLWTDANLEDGDLNGHFLGTSTDFSFTSGVSRTTRSYTDEFRQFRESSPSNGSWWVESFGVKAEESGKWAINVPFTGSRLTPNGWTAENGMWVSERFKELGWESIAFQMKGEGFGSIAFPQNQSPRGIESFTYSARIAQSYDIRSFNHYTGTTNDVYTMSNYTFAVNCAMTTTNDAPFSGLGTVSALANFRDSKGGYEFRVERVSEKFVELALYKWTADGGCRLLGKSGQQVQFGTNAGAGLDGYLSNVFGGMFISCTNLENSVRVTAGLLSQHMNASESSTLSGHAFYKVCYEDFEPDQFRSGTCALGAKDCPASFARPVLSPFAVKWAEDWASAKSADTNFHYWASAKNVEFRRETDLIAEPAYYEAWNIYRERLRIKDYTNELPRKTHGFKAGIPTQTIVVEVSPHLQNDWQGVATNRVTTFGLEPTTVNLYLSEDTDIRLRTGNAERSSDVVVDNLSLRQWRGGNYDDSDNPDRRLFPDYVYGAPTQFVYTTSWITGRSEIELNPMRATESSPTGVRSPLMDGKSGRGLGLGSFSYTYRNADKHARLLIQIATNDVDYSTLAGLTGSQRGWETVATNDFSELTEEARANGIMNCYLGLHGVSGVMRVIVDPELVKEARDPTLNQDGDPHYGQVFITAAQAKDNPRLDTGSWWGWNLRTTDDGTMQLLKDGSYGDVRRYGMSFGLNNSITDDTRVDHEYKQHMPFLQSPIFMRGVVGEVWFKARKYKAGDPNPTVAIYGTTSLNPSVPDSEFEYLAEIEITSDRFETYSYQAPISRNYTAFRFAVTGVQGVTGERGPYPVAGTVGRVLLDEVAIFEAIRARLGFRNVGAFRTHLDQNRKIEGLPSKTEQPLTEEEWGIQTELYAAQLSDKIDLTTPGREPRVFFHWFVGEFPWGYGKWVNHASAHAAELARAENTDELVYRASHLAAPEAIVEPITKSGTVVQYSLEVVYYMKDQSDPLTNVLTAADWTKPSWYDPIDLNETYGNGEFAAFNILDSVAPGWAWFNEVNLFGGYDSSYANVDKDYQYLEIAAPSTADLTDWSVRFLLPQTGNNSVLTNTVATFGKNGLEGKKKDLIGQASGIVFRVIASLPTRKTGKLKVDDGTLDGVWSFPQPDGSVLGSDGRISEISPFAMQLVRSSGAVEHEIVVIGTNFWESAPALRDQFSPTNTANYLNSHMKKAHFFYAGDDDNLSTRSLSVCQSRGIVSNDWDRIMIQTPGRINMYADGTPQVLDEDPPTPFGTSIYIFANLNRDFGHIYQTCGDAVDSTSDQILVLRKGSNIGTNISYRVDNWYELGRVTTNGVEVAFMTNSPLTYTVTVGVNASNNITVVGSATVCKKLRDLGVTDDNKYTPAIIDWVEKGKNAYDVPWPDGDLKLAKWVNYPRDISTAKDMTLTEMYWLDMCPTLPTDQYLFAGFAKCPEPHPLTSEPGITNVRMTVFMVISNGLGKVNFSGTTNTLYSPYVIQGMFPGYKSWDYEKGSDGMNWTNVTFKIKGILMNGQTTTNSWGALRWFVFNEDSFYKPDLLPPGKMAYTTEIEIRDPYATDSPGYSYGWSKWAKEHGYRPLVGKWWALDEDMLLNTVEILKENNYYSD